MIVMIIKNALGEYGASAHDTTVASVLGNDIEDCKKKFVNKFLMYDGDDWSKEFDKYMAQWRYYQVIKDMIE